MNSDILIFFLGSVCICSAIYFVISWFLTFSKTKKLDISTILSEGMSGLSYIGKNNPDFSGDEASKLNKNRRLVYLSMLLGISLIIINQILG